MPKIEFSDLNFGEELGSGASGTVYQGWWLSRNTKVAIKRVVGRINRKEVSTIVVFYSSQLIPQTHTTRKAGE